MWEYIIYSAIAPILSSLGTALFMRRRNKIETERMKVDLDAAKAAAKSADASGDVNVMEMYKKVYEDLSVTLKAEYDKMVEKQSSLDDSIQKLSKEVKRLEMAIKSVSRCRYKKSCPVTRELEKAKKDEM